MAGAAVHTTKRKGGRPRKFDAAERRPTLTFRVRGGLHELLKEAAARSERSLSEEIEHRLATSFMQRSLEEELGGPDLAALSRIVALAGRLVQEVTGKSWREDADTRAKLLATVSNLLYAVMADGINDLLLGEAQTFGANALPVVAKLIKAGPLASELPRGAAILGREELVEKLAALLAEPSEIRGPE